MSEELKPEDTAKDFKLRHEEAIEKIKKLSPDERVKFVSKLWTQTTQKYIKDNPKWFAQRINNSFFLGIARLKDCIENPKDPQISWENPFIELRYPVEIEERETIQAFPKMEDPFTIETMTPWLGDFLLKELDITALRTLNKDYLVLIKNGESAVILPKKLEARLAKLSKEEAQKKLDKMKFKKDFLFLSHGKAKENGKETPFKIILKFSVKPLTIIFNPNDEVLEAYLPMEVGLEYRRGNPAKWLEEDKKDFWRECLKSFNEANKLLEKDQEPVKEEREPEVRPISEDREGLIVGKHFIKEGILGKAKEYLPLEKIWLGIKDEDIKKQAQESGVKILGLDPSWRGLKAIIASYSLLNKIKFQTRSQITTKEEKIQIYNEETGKPEVKIVQTPVKEEVDKRIKAIQKDFGYSGSIPIIEVTLDEYYLAYGIKPQSTPRGWNETLSYQKKEAIDALIESGTRAFVWSYERLKRDAMGKPIKDVGGNRIKELVEAYRPCQIVDIIKDKKGKPIGVRIIPTPIFFDEIRTHFIAYPTSLLDDVYRASGKKGKGRPPTYQFLFILWLLLRANEDKKDFGAGKPESKRYEELANILKMTSYLKGRKTKQLREVMLPKCFDIATKLGYLAEVKEDKDGWIFRINPEAFNPRNLTIPYIPPQKETQIEAIETT